MPHGYCMRWETGLVGLHILSDAFIALAYFSIPFALLFFLGRRPDLVFKPVFALFAAFILSCGLTHAINIHTLYVPNYWLEGGMKAVTAAVSMLTAVVLWKIMPRALTLPSPAQLRTANEKLTREIDERAKAEAELARLNRELDERVRSRTRELEASLKELNRMRSTMVRICAWTKRIEDGGRWVSYEEFMQKHFDIRFTHGISEDAWEKFVKDTQSSPPPGPGQSA